MERLHEAIKKARAQREGAPDKPNLPGFAPQQAAGTNNVQMAWDALPELKIKPRYLQKNRISTLQGGPEAAPYDLLRTRVLQQSRQNGWRRIAVVSPHAACGKTTAVTNLAFSFARQVDTRTVIFDFDLRKRGLSELLRPRLEHSMADVLEGQVPFSDHALRYSRNVAFGLNRSTTRAAAEILQGPMTGETLDEVQTIYQPNLMLFDMPPLNASDDNFGFLQYVDAAVLVVTAEKTTMSQIDVAERQVAELTNVLGVVLNQCRYTDGAYGQDYNYY